MIKNELYHHGILGQKWGIRRFQNKDGTLTSAGKKRKISEKEQKKSSDYIEFNRRRYGVKSQTDDMNLDKRRAEELSKMSLKEYEKRYFRYEEDQGIVKESYETELNEYINRAKDGEAFVKNSSLLEKRLDEIDITSAKYTEVKKLVKKYVNDMINDSISDIEKQKKS